MQPYLRFPRRLPFALLLLFVLLYASLAAWPAGAQEGEGNGSPITAQQVQERLERVKQATDLNESAKNQAVELYEQALSELEQAQSAKARIAEYEKAISEAPELKEQLQQPPEEDEREIPEEASLTELEQMLNQAEADLKAANERLATLQAEPERHQNRRKEIPEAITAARSALEEVKAELEAPVPEGEPEEVTAAKQARAKARQQRLQAEIAANEQELQSYDARTDVFPLRLAQAQRQVKRAQQWVNQLRDVVARRRKQEARETAAETKEIVRQALDVLKQHPVSQEVIEYAESLTQDSIRLAEKRYGANSIASQIEQAVEDQQRIQEKRSELETEFDNVRRKEEIAGLNTAVGIMLRAQQMQLPDVRDLRENIRARQALSVETQIAEIDARQQYLALSDIDGIVGQVLQGEGEQLTEEAREEVRGALRDLLENQRSTLRAQMTDYEDLSRELTELDAEEQRLVELTHEFSDYIQERVLWIRSASPIHYTDVFAAAEATKWLGRTQAWQEVMAGLWVDMRYNPALYVLLAIIGIGLIAIQRPMRQRLASVSEIASKPYCTIFRPTSEALGYTILVAAPASFILGYLGWRLSAPAYIGDFGQTAGTACVYVAVLLYVLQFLHHFLRPTGLAQAHFEWPPASADAMRRLLIWVGAVLVPSAFVLSLLRPQTAAEHMNSLGRFIFLVAIAVLAYAAHKLFRPQNGYITQVATLSGTGRYQRVARFVHIVVTLIPASLFVLSVTGYHYTALRLSSRLYLTVCFIFAAYLIQRLVLRWLLVVRRHLALTQARKRRELLRAQRAAEAEGAEFVVEEDEATALDLAVVDAQTQRLTRSLVLFAVIVGLWFIWANELPALGALNNIEIGETTHTVTETAADGAGAPADGAATDGTGTGTGEPTTRTVTKPITLAHLVLAIFIGFLTVVATKNIPGVLEIGVLQRTRLEAGERYAITTLARYVIIAVGIIFGFQMVGIGWSSIQWLVAAVGIGLGFGLQEIFANFISGIIILFERPIRVGDIVTMNDMSGTVSRIKIRATTIMDFDRKELIVPNREFITSQITNWTLTDTVMRIVVPVGIAYGSDTELAEKLLHQVARETDTVLDDPAPQVWFVGFGDNSLNFELRVFSPNVDSFLKIRHDLHLAIDRAFRKAGIEISFPQRDLHIRTVPKQLLDRIDAGGPKNETPPGEPNRGEQGA